MSNIPKARAILIALLPHLTTPERREVNKALSHMRRRSPVRRAPRKSQKPLTKAQVRTIYRYVRDHPREHLQDIAHSFGLNAGRVSEIIQEHGL